MTTGEQKISERRIKATPVSRGVGIGQVVFFEPKVHRVAHTDIRDDQIPYEIERLAAAVRAASARINKLAKSQNNTASIFDAHLLIVAESPFISEIEDVIRTRKVNAEWAVRLIAELRRKRQSSVPDGHFREKAGDIADVAEHLINELTGHSSDEWAAPPEAIVLARELRPSNIILISKSLPSAIITEHGGWTSHASIIARELKIPMVSGVNFVEEAFAEHDNLIVDAINGEVIIEPEIDTIEAYRTLTIERRAPDDFVATTRNPCITRDGTEITIRANAESADAYETARRFGALGIGLFRSESLIRADGQIPTEDEQLIAYRNIGEKVGDDGVQIRTFDIDIAQFTNVGTSANNPSLGLRSIRLSLTELDYFRTQIRALLRASAEQRIDIILPMVTGLDEILKTQELIESERENLVATGFAAGEPRLGAMIEVPSAVLTAREIAEKVDFLCLGTNDLVQYLLAVDRDNEAVADWYQTLHPAVLRALKHVLSAGFEARKPVVVCGEIAGSPFYVPLLIGAGARELSMNVTSIRNVRRLIAGITVEDATALLEHVMGCKTADEVEIELRAYYYENWSDLFPPDLLSAKHR